MHEIQKKYETPRRSTTWLLTSQKASPELPRSPSDWSIAVKWYSIQPLDQVWSKHYTINTLNHCGGWRQIPKRCLEKDEITPKCERTTDVNLLSSASFSFLVICLARTHTVHSISGLSWWFDPIFVHFIKIFWDIPFLYHHLAQNGILIIHYASIMCIRFFFRSHFPLFPISKTVFLLHGESYSATYKTDLIAVKFHLIHDQFKSIKNSFLIVKLIRNTLSSDNNSLSVSSEEIFLRRDPMMTTNW